MAIFTFVLAFVAVGTLLILRSQLQEMHGGGIDTHDLAVAAGKQADAAKTAANAAKSAADAAAKALRQSTQQFRIDERPWIEIEFGKPTPRLPTHDGFSAMYTYSFSLKNTGKTTALEIQSRIPRGAMMAALSFGDDASQIASEQGMLLKEGVFASASETDKIVLLSKRLPNVLGPGATAIGPLELYGQEPGDGMYRFLTGRIDYSDAFEVKHWTKFCVFVGTGGILQYCRDGNEKGVYSRICGLPEVTTLRRRGFTQGWAPDAPAFQPSSSLRFPTRFYGSSGRCQGFASPRKNRAPLIPPRPSNETC